MTARQDQQPEEGAQYLENDQYFDGRKVGAKEDALRLTLSYWGKLTEEQLVSGIMNIDPDKQGMLISPAPPVGEPVKEAIDWDSVISDVLKCRTPMHEGLVDQLKEKYQPSLESGGKEEGKEAVAFAEWIAKGGYITSTLPIEKEQLWHYVNYDFEQDKYTENEVVTSAQLYSLFKDSEEYKILVGR